MCGIAGIFNLDSGEHVGEQVMREMLGSIRHRGPDQFGIYLDGPIVLGSARLSIIDLSTGQQPISNEDGTLWIVFNGEIFNYIELRAELESRGHRFSTTSDTEVLLHAYEEWGPQCLDRFNGQFAFAIWNRREQALFLARDRLGVRPLFYTLTRGGSLVFGSEIKALLASGRVSAQIDPIGLEQVFTYWSPISPRTVFRDIVEIPPGNYLVARDGKISIKRYWEIDFPDWNSSSEAVGRRSREYYEEELSGLLVDAGKIRLRADVPVGAYLSGGLDSSIIASIIRNFTSNPLDTFSIAFDDEQFDESGFQSQMAEFLGTKHQVVRATHADIGRIFPQVIWHTETPVMRTAPAPMFLLSKLVREGGYKVVLTGEGADEFLGGYDIFKEAKVRRFWASQPESEWRPLLLKRLYPDIGELTRANASFVSAFFRRGLTETESADYSHALRWWNGRRNCRFLSEGFIGGMRDDGDNGRDAIERLTGERFARWEPLARAQFLEIKIFLSQYLLSSQGDRMAMAHSIEGRFPFLDCRVVEFCNRLPATMKLRGLNEKYLLKRLGKKWLPKEIWQRTKRPYRAPIHKSFFNEQTADYVIELLSEAKIAEAGYFKAQAVGQLAQKMRQGFPVSETDDMALAGIISTQLAHELFVKGFRKARAIGLKDDVLVIKN
ncbi:MAG TPA: asparagine synthase (glutamine-hydrolyzing) [Verrucomicrobiae bacterium]|nr:asparagine synthase (glutamine-hydrolyzing) [Verrucomicrobiae bacterium]